MRCQCACIVMFGNLKITPGLWRKNENDFIPELHRYAFIFLQRPRKGFNTG